jgi:hypothetical protein
MFHLTTLAPVQNAAKETRLPAKTNYASASAFKPLPPHIATQGSLKATHSARHQHIAVPLWVVPDNSAPLVKVGIQPVGKHTGLRRKLWPMLLNVGSHSDIVQFARLL